MPQVLCLLNVDNSKFLRSYFYLKYIIGLICKIFRLGVFEVYDLELFYFLSWIHFNINIISMRIEIWNFFHLNPQGYFSNFIAFALYHLGMIRLQNIDIWRVGLIFILAKI